MPEDEITYARGDAEQYLRLRFDPILENEKTIGVLVTTLDTTHEHELQALLKNKEKENSENMALVAILIEQGVDIFSSFISKHSGSMKRLMDGRCCHDLETAREAMRCLHTLKGEAGIFKLKSVADEAHQLESVLKTVMDENRPLGTEEKDAVQAGFRHIVSELKRIGDKVNRVLGEAPDSGEARGASADISLLIPIQKVEAFIEKAAASAPEMLEAARDLKMIPFRKLYNRFPSMVLDLCKKLEKEAELKISGDDLRIDARVLDRIGDAMVHIIRNAVDHGIEGPDTRIKNGKKNPAQITLSVVRTYGSYRITVADDGGGIDPEKIKDKAVKAGLLKPQDREMLTDKKQIYEFLFLPAFSTKDPEEVSQISGRGVGLDVVKTSVTALNGEVFIQSERGVGTSFIIQIPA